MCVCVCVCVCVWLMPTNASETGVFSWAISHIHKNPVSTSKVTLDISPGCGS